MLEEGPDQHRSSPAAEANGARPRKEGRKEQKRQKKDGDTEVTSGSMTEDRRCDQTLSCGTATEANVVCLRARR